MKVWLDEVACHSVDPEVFYPKNGHPGKAKRVCSGCPVRLECLARALVEEAEFEENPERFDRNYRHGVRGGLTARERWELAHPRLEVA